MKRLSRTDGLDLSLFHSILALAIYSALSLLYFSFRTLSEFWTNYRGLGADPTIHMWAMSWWPYAIAHHLNPLVTPVIFAPGGYNLARAVNLPAPSLIIYPVTSAFGPVMAYNVLCLACPIAAAFAAFVLCRYVCYCFWPALLSGYIFGFSEYVLCQMEAHLFLLFIFPVPLAVYLVLLRFDGALGKYSFLILLDSVIAFEFLSSTELFATTTAFGTMALVLSVVLFTAERSKIKSVIVDIAFSYALLILILSPYLYYVLVGGVPKVLNPAEGYSNDALAFVVPSPVLLGGNLFAPITAKFRDTWGEMAAYLGPGVWLIFALFWRTYWRTQTGKLLVLSFAIIALASLGPRLHISGTRHVALPWLLADKVPLIDLALPGRFGMYLFLVAAVIVAIYFSQPGIPAWCKALLGLCAIGFIIPNLILIHSEATKVDTPAFFRSRKYQQYISPGENVLILPSTMTSTSQALLWQAESGFYFHSATGFYLPPEDYQRWPITPSFVDGGRIPNFAEQLDAFLGAHQVKAIIVDAGSSGSWPSMLSEAGLKGVATGGVLFYRVPPGVLSTFRNATARQMVARQTAGLFGVLVIAAEKYVQAGFPLANLTPGELQRLKLLSLPDSQIEVGEHSVWWKNLWLGSRHGLINVGIFGNYQDLNVLIPDYGPEAVNIFFPFPKPLSKRRKCGDGLLLFTFTPQGLRRAANKSNSYETASGLLR
jgi:hypothetical protein